MMLLSLLLLPALVIAGERGVKGVDRHLQTPCDLVVAKKGVTDCEAIEANKLACYGDDPGGEICLKDGTDRKYPAIQTYLCYFVPF